MATILSFSSVIVVILSFVVTTILLRIGDILLDNGRKDVTHDGRSVATGQNEIETPTSFTFSQCGDNPKSLPIQIKKFSIKPDPLVLPGDFKIKVSLRVKEEVQGPIKASLRLQKHTADGWLSLPCNDQGYGSCEYPDMCPYLESIDFFCPKDIKEKGQNCMCPLQPGKYIFKTITLPISTRLDEGPFRIVANFTTENDGRLVACIDTTIVLANGVERPDSDQHHV